MIRLDPVAAFEQLREDLPKKLHGHVLVAGSLAPAYHFRAMLEGRAINTKDADVVVTPAGEVEACKAMAKELVRHGWSTRRSFGDPRPFPTPREELPFIRLYPRKPRDYFIEFLGLPAKDQIQEKIIYPAELDDGWYGVPCFRFMGLNAVDPEVSTTGLRYAAPRMSALANLLSHRAVGIRVMGTPIGGRKILRSAKDLGRVLAIGWLTPRVELGRWPDSWKSALKSCFPKTWRRLIRVTGDGLRALREDAHAFGQAHHSATFGLLRGKGVTEENLRAVAEQLIADVLTPFGGVSASKASRGGPSTPPRRFNAGSMREKRHNARAGRTRTGCAQHNTREASAKVGSHERKSL